MKTNPNKPVRRARKKTVGRKPVKSANGRSSSQGYRDVEGEWLEKHPEKLRPHVGEYVVVEGRRVVAHSKDATKAVEHARRQGIKTPFIFFVPPPLPKNTSWIGP